MLGDVWVCVTATGHQDMIEDDEEEQDEDEDDYDYDYDYYLDHIQFKYFASCHKI